MSTGKNISHNLKTAEEAAEAAEEKEKAAIKTAAKEAEEKASEEKAAEEKAEKEKAMEMRKIEINEIYNKSRKSLNGGSINNHISAILSSVIIIGSVVISSMY